MKIIFLDLDGVMDNAKYDIYLNKHNLPEKDELVYYSTQIA